jgi:hypothetical protein
MALSWVFVGRAAFSDALRPELMKGFAMCHKNTALQQWCQKN